MIRSPAGDIREGRESSDPGYPLGETMDEVNSITPEIIVKVKEMASKLSHPSYYWNKGPIVLTEHGTLLWALPCNICVEMTTDEAFRISDSNNNVVIAVSPKKDSVLLLGNSGAIYTTKNYMEVTAYDPRNKNDKYSRFNVKENEITFSSRESNIAYTVNEGGVRSRMKKAFKPMYKDFSYNILNRRGKIGKKYEAEAVAICRIAKYAFTPQCAQLWRVKGVRISYSFNGELQVQTTTPEMKVCISPSGSANIRTPKLLITSSQQNHPHFYLKKDGLRLFYDGLNYVNRNGSQAAGFDRFGMMRLFAPEQENSSDVQI